MPLSVEGLGTNFGGKFDFMYQKTSPVQTLPGLGKCN